MSAPEFHLAWFAPHIPATLAGRGGTYLLVPTDLPEFQARRKFQWITDSGRPAGEVEAFMSQMSCLRNPRARDGDVCMSERSLIDALKERAQRAGLASSLPPLRATIARPEWARGTLVHGTYIQLVRLGGG